MIVGGHGLLQPGEKLRDVGRVRDASRGIRIIGEGGPDVATKIAIRARGTRIGAAFELSGLAEAPTVVAVSGIDPLGPFAPTKGPEICPLGRTTRWCTAVRESQHGADTFSTPPHRV